MARLHPIRFFFLTFFFYFGIFHVTHDLLRYALAWSFQPVDEYIISFSIAVGITAFLPLLPREISAEQKEAERKILEEAESIDRAARGGGL